MTIRLRVQNTTKDALTGVVVHLTTDDHDLACVTVPTVEVGDLQPGETRETGQAFQFVVADVDRDTLGLDTNDDLSIGFDLTMAGHPSTEVYPSRFRLDLDLNVSGGLGPQTFAEYFEEGMGTFEIDNLDASENNHNGSGSERGIDSYRSESGCSGTRASVPIGRRTSGCA